MTQKHSKLPALLKAKGKELLEDWLQQLHQSGSGKEIRISEAELRSQATEFITLLQRASSDGDVNNIGGPAWRSLRELLESVSRSRALQGFSSDQTATFIFSFKKPLFSRLREELASDPTSLADETWAATELLDRLGILTMQAYQRSREEIIVRQQEEMQELSTPVVKLWDGILALPMIGTLDSARTQLVMESLLQRIADTGSEIAIIDITGVPTVDTLVAQHLLKTVTAIRLMGADCIVSGVRPQIAQTIVHIGVDLQGVITKATLADALSLALKRTGYSIVRKPT